MRIKGVRKQIYLLTYDRPAMNRSALMVKQSFEEVKKLLNPPRGTK